MIRKLIEWMFPQAKLHRKIAEGKLPRFLGDTEFGKARNAKSFDQEFEEWKTVNGK